MLAFAPYVVSLLYSSEFVESVNILRWQVLGDLFKVISWPLGYIVLAQGRAKVFFFTEISWNLLYGGLVYIGLDGYGLVSTGISFLVAYVFYFIILN